MLSSIGCSLNLYTDDSALLLADKNVQVIEDTLIIPQHGKTQCFVS